MDLQIMLRVFSQMQQFRQRDHWTRRQIEAHQASALRSLRTHPRLRTFTFLPTVPQRVV
jgi:hypothetical protein